jgi:hypothetical protein
LLQRFHRRGITSGCANARRKKVVGDITTGQTPAHRGERTLSRLTTRLRVPDQSAFYVRAEAAVDWHARGPDQDEHDGLEHCASNSGPHLNEHVVKPPGGFLGRGAQAYADTGRL